MRIDPERNRRGDTTISAQDSAVDVLVVPTDEERSVAEQISSSPSAGIVESEFAGASCMVAVRILNNPDPPDTAAIGNSPLVLRRSFANPPAVGDVVRIMAIGAAHVLD